MKYFKPIAKPIIKLNQTDISESRGATQLAQINDDRNTVVTDSEEEELRKLREDA